MFLASALLLFRRHRRGGLGHQGAPISLVTLLKSGCRAFFPPDAVAPSSYLLPASTRTGDPPRQRTKACVQGDLTADATR